MVEERDFGSASASGSEADFGARGGTKIIIDFNVRLLSSTYSRKQTNSHNNSQ